MSKRKGSTGTRRGYRDTCLIVTVEEFWEAKVDWFQQCWWNERHTDEEYVSNMTHMGFNESLVRNNLYEEN